MAYLCRDCPIVERTFLVPAIVQLPVGSNVMRCHYVFDLKPRPDGSIDKFKARLVADGNSQKQGVDFDAVFATVVKLASIRIILAVAALRGWRLWQFDIKQAFLQADLQENLYMHMPPNLTRYDADGDALVCRLKKTLYGLRQASREWCAVLSRTLLEYGFRRCITDTCVYRYDDTTTGYVLVLMVYVDDLILCYSHDDARLDFSAYLTSRLPVDDRGALRWVLRMELTQDLGRHEIVVSQAQYARKLVAKYLGPSASVRVCDSPLDETCDLSDPQHSPAPDTPEHRAMAPKRAHYMSAVGALLWLAGGTRPDIAYAVALLARFCTNPGAAHLSALERVLAYVGRTADRVLRFTPEASLGFQVYSDASWATRNSVSGGLVFFHGCAVMWWTRRQKSVSTSTVEAEYFAASLASREAVWCVDFAEDVGFGVKAPTPLLLDNRGAIDLAGDPVSFKLTKHILRKAYELQDRVARGVFAPTFVPTVDQLADILTKALRLGVHAVFIDRLLYDAAS